MTQIQTIIRIRPPIDQDYKFSENVNAATKQSKNTIRLQRGEFERREFNFDHVFDAQDSQTAVFNHINTNIIQDLQNGINRTIITYGQTSSGKTFTLFGDEKSALLTGKTSFQPSETDGILPRILTNIFQNFTNFTCKIQYFQVYNNQIFDLLSAKNDLLKLNFEHNQFSINANTIQISTSNSAFQLLVNAASRRVISSTTMNNNSSRSHTILVLLFEFGGRVKSTLTLCDLAGSERVNKTNSKGIQLEEAKKINQSLSCLQNCVLALSNKQKHVPFRDSNLTKILQNSLQGNSKTMFFGNIGPCEQHFDESFSSLLFINKLKIVYTNVVKNQVVKSEKEVEFDNCVEMTVFGQFGLVGSENGEVGYVRCCCSRCGCNLTVLDEEVVCGDEISNDIRQIDQNLPVIDEQQIYNSNNVVKSLQSEIEYLKNQNLKQKKQLETFYAAMKLINKNDSIVDNLQEDIAPEVEIDYQDDVVEEIPVKEQSPMQIIQKQEQQVSSRQLPPVHPKEVQYSDVSYEFYESQKPETPKGRQSLFEQMNTAIQQNQKKIPDTDLKVNNEQLLNKYLNKGPKLIQTKNSQQYKVPETPQGCF